MQTSNIQSEGCVYLPKFKLKLLNLANEKGSISALNQFQSPFNDMQESPLSRYV